MTIELQKKEGIFNPEVWFLKARTEYSLAKLGHEQSHHAALAIASYDTYRSLKRRLSKSKEKTMKRNIKRLRGWAQ